MRSFLLELYLPRGRSLEEAVALARGAAEAATRDGLAVQYVRSMHLEDDETCFHVFEAASREPVIEAARRAGMAGARVTETVESGKALETAPSEEGR